MTGRENFTISLSLSGNAQEFLCKMGSPHVRTLSRNDRKKDLTSPYRLFIRFLEERTKMSVAGRTKMEVELGAQPRRQQPEDVAIG